MDRKEMVKKLGEHFGVKPKYMSAPSFDYELRTEEEVYTIDRHGGITKRDGESILLESILSQQVTEEPGEVKELDLTVEQIKKEQPAGKAQSAPQKKLADELNGIEVKLNMEGHTPSSLKNIINMIYSKERLIMMAFETEEAFMDDGFAEELDKIEVAGPEDLKKEIENLGEDRCPGFHLDLEEKTFTFRLQRSNLDAERIRAFQDLCILIATYARTLKRASYRQAQEDNPKYALRTWLIRIGMNGEQYKETRKTLMKNLEGSGAYRKTGENHEA